MTPHELAGGVARPERIPSEQAKRDLASRVAARRAMAAVGFAGLLVVIMRSDEVRGILKDLIQQALTFAG